MAQREGTIYLTLFIIMFVLFAVMTTLFIQSNSQVSVLRGEQRAKDVQLKEADDKNRRVSREITELRVAVGGEEYRDQDWPGNEFFVQQMREKAEQALGKILKAVGQTPKKYLYLTAPYEDIGSVIGKLLGDLAKANADRRTAVDVQVQRDTAATETLTTLRAESSRMLTQIGDLETEKEDIDATGKEQKQQYVAQLDEIKDQWSDEVIGLKRELNFEKNKVKSLQNRLDKLQEEVKKEKSLDDVEPDAKVLAVLSESGKVWIDIGRRDHLQKGLIFRVFQYVKGGKRLYKGKIEVRRVDVRQSEGRILEEVDPLNPVTPGDFIASPFYDPEAHPVFVFAGSRWDSKRVTRDYVESQMKRNGAVIATKVDLDTDYLIATENYESSPEYEAARRLGVTVIRERDLLEFIGL